MSQKHRILNYINRHGSISQAEAYEHCGCFRLAARVHELRRTHNIVGMPEPHRGGSHMRYYLAADDVSFCPDCKRIVDTHAATCPYCETELQHLNEEPPSVN